MTDRDGIFAGDDPFVLAQAWLDAASQTEPNDPNAMSLATVDSARLPNCRIVLLKGIEPDGFVFFTNLESRKATQIADNAKVSLLFPWHNLERQVHVTGEAKPLSNADVVKYFVSRPKESQIAAWVSKQSSKITARQALESKFTEMKAKFVKGEVPLPKF